MGKQIPFPVSKFPFPVSETCFGILGSYEHNDLKEFLWSEV